MRLLNFAISFLLVLSSVAFCALPRPQGFVSDYIDLLTPQEKERITKAIEAVEAGTGAEIAIIIQDTLGEYYTKEELAMGYLEQWKVGKKGTDNGLVLLLILDKSRQHGQYRFETGRGLEGDLPDGLLGQIGREELAPYFKQFDYASGILSAVTLIGEILGADMSALRPAKPGKNMSGFWVMLAILFLFFMIGGMGGRRGARRFGGSNLLWLLLFSSMGGRGHRGGGWGSSGGFGGGNFGGGFGGFGGGGGGAGGGAGGSW
jgi:uncharacterized protein